VIASVCIIFLFVTFLTVNMSLSSIDTQEFRPVSRSKRRRGSLQTPDWAGPSFASPNQFAVLSEVESDAEGIGVSPEAVSPGFHLSSSTGTVTTAPLLLKK